jgi:hypothetical protein
MPCGWPTASITASSTAQGQHGGGLLNAAQDPAEQGGFLGGKGPGKASARRVSQVPGADNVVALAV